MASTMTTMLAPFAIFVLLRNTERAKLITRETNYTLTEGIEIVSFTSLSVVEFVVCTFVPHTQHDE